MFVKSILIITSLMLNIGNTADAPDALDGNDRAPTTGTANAFIAGTGDIIREAIDPRRLVLEGLLQEVDNIAGWAAQNRNTKLAILRHISASWINAHGNGQDITTDFISQQLPKYVSFSELNNIRSEKGHIVFAIASDRAKQQDLRYLVFDHTEINRANDELIAVIQQTNPKLTSIIDFGDTQSAEDEFGYSSMLSGRAIIQGDSLSSIGDHFLCKCKGLKEVDLSRLINLTSIGNWFLYSCWNLQEVNLSRLINLTSIENCFLYSCWALQEVNFSGCTGLTSIGDSCLRDCLNLQEVDFSGCTGLTSIGNWLLSYCRNLETVVLPVFFTEKLDTPFVTASRALKNIYMNLDNKQLILPQEEFWDRCKPLEEWRAIVAARHDHGVVVR